MGQAVRDKKGKQYKISRSGQAEHDRPNRPG
jgi:hypothetical protein